MAAGGVGLREVLSGRGFRWLVAVRLTGAISIGLVQAALATFVLFSPERAATPTKVAASFAILLLPYSIIGPFAGVLLDRWRRRQVLVRASLLQAVLVAVLAMITVRGHDGVDLALAVLLVLGVNRFVLAAISAGTPHVVPAHYLVTANAIAPTLGTVASVVGGLLGVVLRIATGNDDHGSMVVLIVAVGVFVVTSVVATRLGPDELGPGPDATTRSLRTVTPDLLEGVAQLRARPRAWRAIALVAAQRLTFGIGVALAVLQVRNGLHEPGQTEAALRDLSLTTGFAGAGAFLGAVVTPKIAQRLGAVRWSSVAVTVGVGFGAVAVWTGTLAGLLLMGLLVGFGGQCAKVCSDATVQDQIDDVHLGRVFSLYDMAVNVAIVAGLTYAVFLTPTNGRSLLVSASMAAIAAAAGVLAVRADRRDTDRVPDLAH